MVRDDLIEHGFDTFMDVENLDSGEFVRKILSQIEAREHFIVLLQPGSLDQISEDGDWLHREIAYALAHNRNVVPVTADGFKFRRDLVLPTDVAGLPSLNAIVIPPDYFPAAMEKLRTRFLKTPPKPPAAKPETLSHRRERAKSDQDLLIYDSDTEDPAFATWTYYAEGGVTSNKFRMFVDKDGKKVLNLISRRGETVGLNKSIALTAGVVEFDYMISGPDSAQGAFFAILPMEETGPNRTGLIEAGGSVQDDPKNPASPYRIRYFIPNAYRNDGQWHHHRMEFDFDGVPNIFYTIFAPRINEGMHNRSFMAEVYVAGVRVWRSQ